MVETYDVDDIEPNDISLCPFCNCVTHTIFLDGHKEVCGKCKMDKTDDFKKIEVKKDGI
jgi:hypothetical protein